MHIKRTNEGTYLQKPCSSVKHDLSSGGEVKPLTVRGQRREFFMSGNQACAEGAIAAGCRFYGGYPITPSSEIAEYMSRRLPQVGGHYLQMEDEIGSIAAVIGASMQASRA